MRWTQRFLVEAFEEIRVDLSKGEEGKKELGFFLMRNFLLLTFESFFFEHVYLRWNFTLIFNISCFLLLLIIVKNQ